MKLFLNDKYTLLKYLYDKKLLISNHNIALVNQETIAKELKFSKTKVNNIIQELMHHRYLDKEYKGNGAYKLPQKTTLLIEFIANIEEQFNE